MMTTTLSLQAHDPIFAALDAISNLSGEQALLCFDPDGSCIYASPSCAQILSSPTHALKGKSFEALHLTPDSNYFFHTAPRATDFPAFVKNLQNESTLSSCNTSETLQFSCSLMAFTTHAQVGVLVSCSSRTHTMAQSWQPLLDQLPFGTLLYSEHGEVVFANKAARQITQHSGPVARLLDANHVHLKTPRGERLSPEDHPALRALVTKENILTETILLCRHDGQLIRLECSALHLQETAHNHVLFVFRDVSARYKRAIEKGDLLSIASHELRNPLTPLKGLLQMMAHDRHEKRPVNPVHLEKAQGQVERLVKLVDGLLDLSIVETGRFSYSKKRHDIRELLDELVAGWCIRHGDERFILDLPEEPVFMHIDSAGIEQVINNLLDNAIKHSPKDQPVWIKLELDEDGSHTIITLKDRGLGFVMDESEQLFERFAQGKNATKTHPGSLGIGLYICKRIVEEHRGSIELRSIPHEGTVVTVKLPQH